MSESDAKKALRDWIISKSRHKDAAALTDETLVLEQRILNSVQIMDLILYLEELSQKPFDMEKLKPGVFSSVNKIYETFFQETH